MRILDSYSTYHRSKKILLIHTGGIGDLIMATPALRSLRQVFPKAKIHFLGNTKSIEVIQRFPYIDKIITLDTSKVKSNHSLLDAPQVFHRLLHLRRQKYEALFVLQPQLSFGASIRMGIFVLSLGIPKRFGRNTKGRGFFLNRSIQENSSSTKHEVERMLEVIRLSCVIPENYSLEMPISQDDRYFASQLLGNKGIKPSDFIIAFGPGFGKPTRGWYPQRWARLGDLLIDKYGAKIVLLGGIKEIELSSKIAYIMKNRSIIITGKTTIFQSAALLEQCHLLICNDSGLMHLATAVGTNIVALFGPGDYNRIKPYANPDSFVIVNKKISCAPCYKLECKDHRCMKEITVENVFNAAETLISKTLVDQSKKPKLLNSSYIL